MTLKESKEKYNRSAQVLKFKIDNLENYRLVSVGYSKYPELVPIFEEDVDFSHHTDGDFGIKFGEWQLACGHYQYDDLNKSQLLLDLNVEFIKIKERENDKQRNSLSS